MCAWLFDIAFVVLLEILTTAHEPAMTAVLRLHLIKMPSLADSSLDILDEVEKSKEEL